VVHGIAQNKFTVSGTVKDEQSGEILIGATVKIQELNINVVTNGYGFYSITIPKGNFTVVSNFTGYLSTSQKLNINTNIQLPI